MSDSKEDALYRAMFPDKEQEAFQHERLKWAIATAPNDPHLWQHKYKGTPLQILLEHARRSI
jgi:hypothetical protein